MFSSCLYCIGACVCGRNIGDSFRNRKNLNTPNRAQETAALLMSRDDLCTMASAEAYRYYRIRIHEAAKRGEFSLLCTLNERAADMFRYQDFTVELIGTVGNTYKISWS